jgi:hypothetical protein
VEDTNEMAQVGKKIYLFSAANGTHYTLKNAMHKKNMRISNEKYAAIYRTQTQKTNRLWCEAREPE